MPRRVERYTIDSEFHADFRSAIGNCVRGFAGDRQRLKVLYIAQKWWYRPRFCSEILGDTVWTENCTLISDLQSEMACVDSLEIARGSKFSQVSQVSQFCLFCCCCCGSGLPSATMIECRMDAEKRACASGLVLEHQAMVCGVHLHCARHHHYFPRCKFETVSGNIKVHVSTCLKIFL